jgi:hypothetical protein
MQINKIVTTFIISAVAFALTFALADAYFENTWQSIAITFALFTFVIAYRFFDFVHIKDVYELEKNEFLADIAELDNEVVMLQANSQEQKDLIEKQDRAYSESLHQIALLKQSIEAAANQYAAIKKQYDTLLEMYQKIQATMLEQQKEQPTIKKAIAKLQS